MDTPQKIAQDDGNERIVYVRPVDPSTLPSDVREQAQGISELYAVHAANGDRLALVNGEKLAFILARQNDMTPVYVH
jgi:hypothetical protein